ncbi:MAG TPA: hypothetical protein VFM08_03675 [Nocardioides sp.]|jgi:hypothetical protein|nr:hypothetical protein [Nocardioides sp.]
MYRKLFAALLGAVSALTLALVPSAALADQGRHGGNDLIRMDLTPSLPTDAAINGVNPGGLPWIIDRGEVRLRQNGRLDVRIEGLQVPRADGTADNPVGSIDAVVYSDGRMVADSGPMPMSIPDGDARFRVRLHLPSDVGRVSILISPSAAVGAAYIASAGG